MISGIAAALLLTMLLQTLSATNNRVMLPLMVHHMGGDDLAFGNLQAIRHISICTSLVLTPLVIRTVKSCCDKGRKSWMRTNTYYNNVLPLAVLLPLIASLNCVLCNISLDSMAYALAFIEALNCMIYILMKTVSQTLPDPIIFTTQMRLVQSFGSALLGPVSFFLMSLVNIPSNIGDDDGNYGGENGSEISDWQVSPRAGHFAIPFYLQSFCAVVLAVSIVCLSCTPDPYTKKTVKDKSPEKEEIMVKSRNKFVHSTISKVSFANLWSIISQIGSSKSYLSKLMFLISAQSFLTLLGECAQIGIFSHLKATDEQNDGNVDAFHQDCSVVFKDAAASMVGFAAVLYVGRSIKNIAASGLESSILDSEKNEKAVLLVLHILNLAAGIFMIAFSVVQNRLLVSCVYIAFRCSIRCIEIPLTLLVGLYIKDDDRGGQYSQKTESRLPLNRLAMAFSVMKFSRSMFRIFGAWLFTQLYGRTDGWSFSRVSLACGVLTCGISIFCSFIMTRHT